MYVSWKIAWTRRFSVIYAEYEDSRGSMLVGSLFMGTMMYFMINFMRDYLFESRYYKSSKKPYDEYLNYLAKGIENNTFDEEFCKIAFNHFDRKSNNELSKYGYTELLEDFVIFISTKSDSINAVDTLNYNKAMDILKIAQKTEPFASLPSEERRLMDNIQLFLQNNDIDNSLNALNELKQVILLRHREYQKVSKQNSWSIPLAFIGIGFTFIFGIITMVKSLRKESKILLGQRKKE